MPRGKRKNDKEEEGKEEESSERENTAPNAALIAKLQALLEEYDLEVESRCLAMQSQADHLAMGLRNALHMELMKLPKKVRTMPMHQFLKEYQGDFGALARPLGTSAAVNASVAPTPARGDAAKITLKLEGGRALDLDASMAQSLDAHTKEEAKARLLTLQSQLHSLMAALR